MNDQLREAIINRAREGLRLLAAQRVPKHELSPIDAKLKQLRGEYNAAKLKRDMRRARQLQRSIGLLEAGSDRQSYWSNSDFTIVAGMPALSLRQEIPPFHGLSADEQTLSKVIMDVTGWQLLVDEEVHENKVEWHASWSHMVTGLKFFGGLGFCGLNDEPDLDGVGVTPHWTSDTRMLMGLMSWMSCFAKLGMQVRPSDWAVQAHLSPRFGSDGSPETPGKMLSLTFSVEWDFGFYSVTDATFNSPTHKPWEFLTSLAVAHLCLGLSTGILHFDSHQQHRILERIFDSGQYPLHVENGLLFPTTDIHFPCWCHQRYGPSNGTWSSCQCYNVMKRYFY